MSIAPLKINAWIAIVAITLLGGGAGWKLINMFERVVVAASTEDRAAIFTAGETALVALLAATLGVAITGLISIAIQIITDPPPPAYPAGPMNELLVKIGLRASGPGE